jgi:D-3-phosphoglycerate dehydrogenase
MNISVFEKNEIDSHALSLLEKSGHHLLFNSVDADSCEAILVRTYTKVDKDLLDKYPKLKYILRVGVGLDNIDSEECKRRNIYIINSPGANAHAVSELVLLYTLLLKRKIIYQIEQLKTGKWRNRNNMGTEVKASIIGIIGCGAIGQLVAKKFLGFDAQEILGFDPFLTSEQLKNYSIRKTELDYLIRNSDIISIHVPLTRDTRNLISSREFSQMGKNAIVINTARGGIVNEHDLILALNGKRIGGAAIDVFENEPHINKQLLNIPNLICTPHIGALTEEADKAMSVETVSNFLQLLATLTR